MGENKAKFLKIIIYVAIIISVILIRITGKEITFKTVNNKVKITLVSKSTDEQEDGLKSENTSLQDEMNKKEDEKSDKLELINKEYIENIETGLYDENQSNEIYGDEVYISFKLVNGNLLYDEKLPLGTFENMLENFQLYFNNNLMDAPITEVTIIEDSIEITKEKLNYIIETNTNEIIKVTVDLQTFNYSFEI